MLVDASHERDAARRREQVLRASDVLTPDEVYLAGMVIALFNFYNTFVDLNGVDELTPQGYEASGGLRPTARPGQGVTTTSRAPTGTGVRLSAPPGHRTHTAVGVPERPSTCTAPFCDQ